MRQPLYPPGWDRSKSSSQIFSPAHNSHSRYASCVQNLVNVLLYDEITRINVRSSPLSRHDGSQSSRPNTNLGSLTSHVCLLAVSGIATGSPPKMRPKLITKCAALSAISQWFLFSFAYALFQTMEATLPKSLLLE